MEEDQMARSQERVRVLSDAVGLPVAEDRIAALAEAFDGARLMIAQLEPLAARIDVPVGAPFDAAWAGEGGR